MTNHKGNPIPHPAWNKGLSWTQEIRDKISQGMLAYWQVDREEKIVGRVVVLRQATLLSWRTNMEERLIILRKNADNRWQRQQHTYRIFNNCYSLRFAMNTSISKPVIFVVIAVLVVALVYSPAATTFYVFAAQPVEEFLNSPRSGCNIPSEGPTSGSFVTCCWNNIRGYLTCQTCTWTQGVGYSNCSNVESALEQTPTPPPSGPAAPLQDGGVLQQPPSGGETQPPTRGQGVLPQDGVLQQQEPTDQGAAPRTVEPPTGDEATQPSTEPLPPCPEGQVLDEETNLCVLEEQEATEEPTTEEDQPSEESDSEDNNNN